MHQIWISYIGVEFALELLFNMNVCSFTAAPTYIVIDQLLKSGDKSEHIYPYTNSKGGLKRPSAFTRLTTYFTCGWISTDCKQRNDHDHT